MSEWNQWLAPAPMMIIDRPPERSALSANSRAMRTVVVPGTPVISSAQAGVPGSGSSYDAGQTPGNPSRPTP